MLLGVFDILGNPAPLHETHLYCRPSSPTIDTFAVCSHRTLSFSLAAIKMSMRNQEKLRDHMTIEYSLSASRIPSIYT